MLRLSAFALLCVVSGAFVRAETPAKKTPLLNGKDFAGWEFVISPAADIATVCKYNADGSVAVAGKPVGYLLAKQAYENFTLHVEWRWPANAAKNSNSGVLLNIAGGPAAGTAWPVCFQAQMKLTRAGDILPMNGAKFAEKLSTPADAKTPQLDRTGKTDPEKPLGEWNSYDLVCRNGTIEVAVNGVPQNKITHCEPAAGRFGLQLEGTPYEIRNVWIAPIK